MASQSATRRVFGDNGQVYMVCSGGAEHTHMVKAFSRIEHAAQNRDRGDHVQPLIGQTAIPRLERQVDTTYTCLQISEAVL